MQRLCRAYSTFGFCPILSRVLKKLLTRRLGKNIGLEPGFFCLFGNIRANNVSLGDTKFIDYAEVEIGENTGFSFDNMVITSTHNLDDWNEIIKKPVKIGKNCWITSRCVILPGVTIGDNVIIGAGSVVTKDVPNNCLAAGNPCRVIRENIGIKGK